MPMGPTTVLVSIQGVVLMSLNGSIPVNGSRKGMWLKSIPAHPGFFRKTRSPYSTMIAGIISTSPGITLGNNFDAKADKWEDNRPMLALAGRVPVKVTTENGPIQIGDLLVSSSTPGYAMRCSDRVMCVGATIGKALEPLAEGIEMR